MESYYTKIWRLSEWEKIFFAKPARRYRKNLLWISILFSRKNAKITQGLGVLGGI
jgi:hypothetical protein